MNSNIKGSMGCSSNTNTSTSLLKMASGSSQRITNFDNEAQKALQKTSLASKLQIKDIILKECLHICNQNFDNRKYQHCVQCSEDDWMVWNFYYDKSKIIENIAGTVQKFHNVFHVRPKKCSRFLFSGVTVCCMIGERGIHWRYEFIPMRHQRYEFIPNRNMNL